MAVAKKNARNITVEGIHYRWRATGNDGWISLVVWPHERAGDKLVTRFTYHQAEVPFAEGGGAHLVGQLVVTNRLVRRLVLHALQTGYVPDAQVARQRNLGWAEGIIDVRGAVRAK